TAQKSDLQAFRSGDISKETFNERLKVSKTAADDEGPVDLKVMASIFETAFEDAEKSFQVNGSVNYLYLDNFGALFSFEAGYAETSGWNFANIRINVEKIRIELEEAREELEHVLSDDHEDSTGSVQTNDSKKFEEKRAQHKKEVLKAYEQFKQRIKQYLVDYGRTLSSVGENQQILVSVNLDSSVNDIPERIDLRLQKSVLEEMDNGELSREEAMSEIEIREY
ncbi:MAG TPA: hypothetical protein VFG39_04900, partial [Balneolaceae bacterium]|nr:hypothetical protein [Balneolaceae bacterium]